MRLTWRVVSWSVARGVRSTERKPRTEEHDFQDFLSEFRALVGNGFVRRRHFPPRRSVTQRRVARRCCEWRLPPDVGRHCSAVPRMLWRKLEAKEGSSRRRRKV